MMMITKLFTLVLFAVQGAYCVAEILVPLDTMVMHLESQSDSDSSALLGEIVRLTTNFLKDYFAAYYNGMGTQSFFEDVELVASTFGIQGNDGSFVSAFEFDGEVTFGDGQAEPSAELMTSLMNNAFKGQNMNLFLEHLLKLDDPFLGDVTRVMIEINNVFVTDTNPKDSRYDSNETSDQSWDLNNWVEVAIYTAAGALGAVLVFGLYWLFTCFRSRRGQVHDEEEALKIKKIEIPSDRQPSQPPLKSSQPPKSSNNNHKKPNEMSPKSSRPRPSPPSPSSSTVSKSVVSQDSSFFTYGREGMYRIPRDAGTLSLGSISNLHLDFTSNFDIDAWQNPTFISSKVPAPFGHDISAIEQRDQMSMMEGDDNILRSRGSNPRALHTKKSKSNSLHRPPAAKPTRSSTREYPYSSSVAARYTATIPEVSSRESSSEVSMSNSSDVISDLKNLSMQIDQHRRAQR
jgi:hypothetical protein